MSAVDVQPLVFWGVHVFVVFLFLMKDLVVLLVFCYFHVVFFSVFF